LARSANCAASASVHGGGQGTQKALGILRQLGIDTSRTERWPQVDAALKIRNCLMHASGLLEESRDKDELRRLVKSRSYFSPAHRKRITERDGGYVAIVQTSLGERLQITNDYSWLVGSYLYSYYEELCNAGQMKFGWPQTEGEPDSELPG